MNNEEKTIFEFMNNLSEEESTSLLDGVEIEDIKLNEVQKKRMESIVLSRIILPEIKGTSKGMKKLAIAVIAFIIILSAFIPFGQNSLAEIIKRLYFIPGKGTVVDDKGTDIFVLSQPIKYQNQGSEIVVNSVKKDKGNMSIEMTGNTFGGSIKLTLEDDKGNKYVSGWGILGNGYGWIGNYEFTAIPENMNRFSILIADDIKIPVILKKAQSYDDYASMGPTDIKNTLGLTLVSSKYEDKIRFQLIEHQSPNRQVELYGKEGKEGHSQINMSVKDEDGNVYPVEYAKSSYGTLSEFSFKPSNKSLRYSVEIPEVRMHYKVDKEITLSVPNQGENLINKNIDMNGFTFKILKVIRQENKLRVYVDTNYDENKPENLSRVNFDIDSDYKDYSWNYNDDIIAEYYEFEVKPGDKKVKIKFSDMYTILKGTWKFDLSVK